jgi:hypothetical protein
MMATLKFGSQHQMVISFASAAVTAKKLTLARARPAIRGRWARAKISMHSSLKVRSPRQSSLSPGGVFLKTRKEAIFSVNFYCDFSAGRQRRRDIPNNSLFVLDVRRNGSLCWQRLVDTASGRIAPTSRCRTVSPFHVEKGQAGCCDCNGNHEGLAGCGLVAI